MTESQKFIDTLRLLGIKFEICWHVTKKEWQKAILASGYNLTALGCFMVSTEDAEYLFSYGQAHWTSKPEKGYGPSGVFLLSRSKRTKEVQKRLSFIPSENKFTGPSGLLALKRSYPGQWRRKRSS